MPQTTIGNIQQDKHGFLWMNSQFGIVRFDGENAKVFTTQNVPGLSSNRIRLCAKGLDSAIYFIDENHVILKAKSPNSFEAITTKKLIELGYIPLNVSANNNDIAFLNVGTLNGYKEFVQQLNFDTTREFLKSYVTGKERGYLFYIDQQQNTLLYCYDGKHYTLTRQERTFKPQHTFKLNQVVFAQSSSVGAVQYAPNGKKKSVSVTGLPLSLDPFFTNDNPVLFSNETGVFFYAAGRLYQYAWQNNTIQARLIFKDLPCTGVTNVMQEQTTGDYFISTKSTGFYRIKKKQFRVINVATADKKVQQSDGRDNNIIYAHTLWNREEIFTNGYITPVNGKHASRHFDAGNKGRFSNFFLYNKDSNQVWVNFNDSIQSFHTVTRTYTPILKVLEPKKVIELSNGTSIVVAVRNILAWKPGSSTELFRNNDFDFTTAEKVSEDCLLVGAINGLYYFYPSSRQLVPIKYKHELKVRCIFKDRQNRVWFTTYGQGLFYLNGQSVIPLPLDNAGYLSIAHSIEQDNKEHFWVSTNHGLFWLNYTSLLAATKGQTNKLYYTYFDKSDGFNTNEFNGGCSPSSLSQKETGLHFFPSMNGIVVFRADGVKSVVSNKPLFFDKITLNDTGQLYHLPRQLLFDNNTKSIRLHFASPYYGHGTSVQYSYALSTAPEEWKDLGNNRSIELSNLAGGAYSVILKKEEAAGTLVFARLNFEIEKKFTETLLFKALLLLAVTALVFLFFTARLRHLKRERNRLELEVRRRTADQETLIMQLKDTVDDLTLTQSELSHMIDHKESILAVLIHDIKSPLRFLNNVADYQAQNISTNTAEKNNAIAGEMAQSLNRLYLFTQDFAVWMNATGPGAIHKVERADLEELLADVWKVYKELAVQKGLIIQQDLQIRYIDTSSSLLKSVLRNIVDNAIKNSTSGSIAITALSPAHSNRCFITIKDEGRGMGEKEITEINQYFNSEALELSFSTMQFGHKIIRDFLRILSGTIHYTSNNPNGVCVTLSLPMAADVIKS